MNLVIFFKIDLLFWLLSKFWTISLKTSSCVATPLSQNNKRFIPSFLVDGSLKPKNKLEIVSALNLVGDFFEKSILRPNNINFPSSRNEFIKYLKN